MNHLQTGWNLRHDHCFATLAEDRQDNPFYTAMPAERVGDHPKTLAFNTEVAAMIGMPIDAGQHIDFAAVFCGNMPLAGSFPLAMAYSGHQFGHWAGQLGDGRALLLTQVRDSDHRLWDVQLKGSGLTPYSRMGDGRAVLRSCVREYLAGIALRGLGIPTSHALCLVATHQQVRRESQEAGAVLTRVARSHLRFGHFEHFCHHNDHPALEKLMQHTLDTYFPNHDVEDYFATICQMTAELIAAWQTYGFAHGVMNTDNMSATGITLDYGPYGFMDDFDLAFVCNASDYSGRYRFDRQPEIGQWNLWALANALVPLLPLGRSQKILAEYLPHFQKHYHRGMLQRLGLADTTDKALWQGLLLLLQKSHADYNLSFWQLHDWLDGAEYSEGILALSESDSWLKEYRDWVNDSGGVTTVQSVMQCHNPRYVLRNWLAEDAILGLQANDDTALQRLAKVLAAPFDTHAGCDDLCQPPPMDKRSLAISCSS